MHIRLTFSSSLNQYLTKFMTHVCPSLKASLTWNVPSVTWHSSLCVGNGQLLPIWRQYDKSQPSLGPLYIESVFFFLWGWVYAPGQLHRKTPSILGKQESVSNTQAAIYSSSLICSVFFLHCSCWSSIAWFSFCNQWHAGVRFLSPAHWLDEEITKRAQVCLGLSLCWGEAGEDSSLSLEFVGVMCQFCTKCWML